MTRGRPRGPVSQREAERLRERLAMARAKRSPESVAATRIHKETFVRFIPDAFLKNPDAYQGIVGHFVDENECWVWTGSVVQKRYALLDGEQVLIGGKPVVNLDGQSKSVRRELFLRRPHGGQYAREHPAPYEAGVWPLENTCGNARCVNPEHCQERVPTFLEGS
jgi:hypothetical protein